MWFRGNTRKSDARVPKCRSSHKNPLRQGLAFSGKRRAKNNLKNITICSCRGQTARGSTCAGWEPSMRAAFPMGYTDLDYQSKLGLGQTDVMPDTSAELVCFA